MGDISDVLVGLIRRRDLNKHQRKFRNYVLHDESWTFKNKGRNFQMVSVKIPQVKDDSVLRSFYIITPKKEFNGREELLQEMETMMTERGFYVVTNPKFIPYEKLQPQINYVFEEFYSEIQ